MSKPSFRASRPPAYRPKASQPPFPHQPSPFDGPGRPLNGAPYACQSPAGGGKNTRKRPKPPYGLPWPLSEAGCLPRERRRPSGHNG
jgi:hypothetical protein